MMVPSSQPSPDLREIRFQNLMATKMGVTAKKTMLGIRTRSAWLWAASSGESKPPIALSRVFVRIEEPRQLVFKKKGRRHKSRQRWKREVKRYRRGDGTEEEGRGPSLYLFPEGLVCSRFQKSGRKKDDRNVTDLRQKTPLPGPP